MDDYAGRVLADRYRLPLPPSDEYELAESRAFDTYSGQEVLVRQVPLPEVVEAEVLDEDDLPEGFVPREGARPGGAGVRRASARTTRRPTDPAVRRAMEAAQTAAQIPDHPRLDQVFDVFAEGGSLWIVSELVAARPLAALLADQPLSPYRAAEVAADVLAALRVLHAHGWVHRNITARTVLICDDGRVMLTGLAAGAAEEALCGYDPRPVEAGEAAGSAGSVGNVAAYEEGAFEGAHEGAGGGSAGLYGGASQAGYESASQAGYEDRGMPLEPAPEAYDEVEWGGEPGQPGGSARGGTRGARGGSVAAYRPGAARASARAASARVEEEPQPGRATGVPGPRGGDAESGTAGRISDPYGVGGTKPWHGAVPRGGGQKDFAARDTDRGGQGGGRGGDGARGPGQAGRGENGARVVAPREYGGGLADRGQGGAAHPPHTPGTPRDTRGAWDGPGGETGAPRGPATALAAERARHARMVVVGAVTERWAPEQAGPVHENWQLAAPIGPATDLWALGALLFRAVQGHAPYPEDSTAELVQVVCAEPPAFAEECGPLRPVVESLLRQDPTDRLDFEELSGWLRSLVRSAPEPEAGAHVVPVPPYDAGRLPVVRRRGEVVRRRRAAAPVAAGGHGRHKRGRGKETRAVKAARVPREPRRLRAAPPREAEPVREAAPQRVPQVRGSARPRSLGRLLLLAILIGLAAAVAYAMLFLPKADEKGSGDRAGAVGEASADPGHEDEGDGKSDGKSGDKGEGEGEGKAGNSPSSQEARTSGPEVPQGFTLRKDTEGFRVAVARGWDRQPKNGRGQVRYTHGDFELLVVPGRDTTDSYGSDPMKYQREHERELQPFRDSSWATSSGMRRIDVGGRAMAEGQFTWQDGQGREVFVRNLAMVAGGKYHVVQVRGPEAERDEVTRLFEQASKTYQVTD
ncbi:MULTISPECIES: protein kinase [Streptomyces]|uniref:protein kinase n=1 Tax=Streptomyces TaxID=1883 RepID=UPI001E42D851|nr:MULTISPECIES: protein kinase [Streptomyces]UFQ17521.1 protein kinase [Streptomyces huasconensis]WCL87126.1 protein kinase [Streptomyces sp. JCM 35825]